MVFNKAKDSYDDFYFESERAALAKKKKNCFSIYKVKMSHARKKSEGEKLFNWKQDIEV